MTVYINEAKTDGVTSDRDEEKEERTAQRVERGDASDVNTAKERAGGGCLWPSCRFAGRCLRPGCRYEHGHGRRDYASRMRDR